MADKKVVWLATPLRHFEHDGALTPAILDSLDPHYADPIRELGTSTDLPWEFYVTILGGGGVARARNRVASEFMESKADILFFVDYDLMPTAQHYVNVLSCDLPICGGLYTVRADYGHWVLNKLTGAAPKKNGLLQVMELGTGFKCFKREVFTKVLADNPWLDCESDFDHRKRELGFFSMGPVACSLWPGRHRWLTEDYWFDWLCRESGFPIVANTNVKLRHKDDFNGKIYPQVFPDDPGRLPSETPEP